MAKIMLVEDDNNLREIYGARLQAEGHEIVAAKDGEEALAIAVKEKPDLIISDVMMPRVSGFDMLDILRNAPETRDTKVIMMTALSQAEDKARADKLGADRYLVKSQVTLEDVANVVREVLAGDATPPATPADVSPVEASSATETAAPVATPTPPTVQDVPVAAPPADDTAASVPAEPSVPPASDPVPATDVAPELPTEPSVAPPSTPTPEAPVAEPTKINVVEEPTAEPQIAPEAPAVPTPSETPVSVPTPTVVLPTPPDEATAPAAPESIAPELPTTPEPAEAPVGPNLAEALAEEEKSTDQNESDVVAGGPERPDNPLDDEHGKKKVIEPLNDLTEGPDLQALVAAEEAKTTTPPPANPAPETPPTEPGDPHSKIAL